MKKAWIGILIFLCACASWQGPTHEAHYKMQTQREEPYYLSIDAKEVQDACPGNDIMTQYTCDKKAPDGFSCFDVYMVQGRPAGEQAYSLLQENISRQSVTAQPLCPTGMLPKCDSFLQALHNNLEFSWYLVDFPSSSFPECRETYDCKRIDCYLPTETDTESTLVSCVYKRNQIFFVGSTVQCRKIFR
ncbi:MAG: hypothetical protein IJ311_05660 [Elusimicrobiaceae bacterium]|nr:hypothetical protein [Elusimicrobiaceae bacterium]